MYSNTRNASAIALGSIAIELRNNRDAKKRMRWDNPGGPLVAPYQGTDIKRKLDKVNGKRRRFTDASDPPVKTSKPRRKGKRVKFTCEGGQQTAAELEHEAKVEAIGRQRAAVAERAMREDIHRATNDGLKAANC